MPAPTNYCKGCKYAELQYHTASAIQSRIIAHAAYRGQRNFDFSTSRRFAPHRGRNYMPTAAAVLNFQEAERDTLGDWASEGSERIHARCKASYRGDAESGRRCTAEDRGARSAR